MRTFTLTNAKGQTYDLNSSNNLFHTPTGLGFTDSTSFVELGRIYEPLEQKFEQAVIKGKVFFSRPSAYEKYYDFTRFLQSTPLVLSYTADETFYMKVRAQSISKSELEMGGIGLECEIQLVGLTRWYKTVTVYNSGDISGGKTYSYTYPYSYTSDVAMSVVINSDSYNESGCKLAIYGPVTNPTWIHYLNSEQMETGYYEGTIPINHKLVIDSTGAIPTIQELDMSNTLVADRYSQCDFSTERFIYLGYGKNRISVSATSATMVPVSVEAMIEYETV